MRLLTPLVFTLAVLVTACATNGFEKYYRDQTGGKPLSELAVIPSTDEPRMVQGADPKTDAHKMLEDGYLMLGYSQFNGPMANSDDAITVARALHVEVVIVYSSYSNTVSGVMPIVTPTTQTSYSTGNATAYGSNGTWANAYGNGSTTTYGSQTNYIPYSVRRFDQGAQYWIKKKPPIFGIYARDLSDEKRREIASNKGVEVVTVVKGSPAFNSDFLDGDIIRKIDGHDIGFAKDFHDACETAAGKTVTIEGLRDGKPFTKTVTMNPSSI